MVPTSPSSPQVLTAVFVPQVFTAIFADYTAKDPADYPSTIDLLRTCVPHFVMAERQRGERVAAECRLAQLERQVLQPVSRSFRSQAAQTDQSELDVNAGVFALKVLSDPP